MLIQVYVKDEPVVKCDLLIAKEDAVAKVPIAGLKDLLESPMAIRLVKPHENMGMKAAVYAAEAIATAEAVSSPVFVACADKAILDGMCSMDYAGPAGGPIKCMPSGTKPQAPPRVRNRAKPKPQEKPAPEPPAEPEAPGQDNAGAPDGSAAPAPGAAAGETYAGLMDDPAFVKGDEADLGDTAPEPAPPAPDPAPDPAVANAPKIMKILKDRGVPSGQVPGVLEALREAMDARITLPMQVKLKLAKDGATGDMDPEETARLVAPAFDELKALLKEIDDRNAAKQ